MKAFESKTITHTTDFSPNVSWEPFIDGPMAGLVGHFSGKKVYVYLNPSSSGEGLPDVFVYEGEHRDPEHDFPVCFVTPSAFEKGTKP